MKNKEDGKAAGEDDTNQMGGPLFLDPHSGGTVRRMGKHDASPWRERRASKLLNGGASSNRSAARKGRECFPAVSWIRRRRQHKVRVLTGEGVSEKNSVTQEYRRRPSSNNHRDERIPRPAFQEDSVAASREEPTVLGL